MEFNPFLTLGQVVSTVWKQKRSPLAVFRALAPNRYVHSLDEIPAILEENGIEGIIWDVDNTLMAYHGSEFGGDEKRIFDQLGDYPRVILSNSGETRYFELGELLHRFCVCIKILNLRKECCIEDSIENVMDGQQKMGIPLYSVRLTKKGKPKRLRV
ncbi:MAG: hypothetical protein QT07_C0005G0031 [archaeon GW2011_AR16]|nr:MAG: hypothetical protein QT07_C0005G0031 [archaeon GW2011_AR16]